MEMSIIPGIRVLETCGRYKHEGGRPTKAEEDKCGLARLPSVGRVR